MRQAVMTAPGSIEFREVEKPSPKDNEVLMQTRRIGICGSDIHVFHGKHPYTSYPVVQGHEIAGIVAAVGQDVRGVAVGDFAFENFLDAYHAIEAVGDQSMRVMVYLD